MSQLKPAPASASPLGLARTEDQDASALDRRQWLRLAGLSALQLAVLGQRTAFAAPGTPPGELAAASPSPEVVAKTPKAFAGFGPLQHFAPANLDLPAGFRAVIVQRAARERLDDGRFVPGCFDGMACFAPTTGPAAGQWVLLRNHEFGDADFLAEYGYKGDPRAVPWDRATDRPVNRAMFGGVSRVRLDPTALRAVLAEGATQPKGVGGAGAGSAGATAPKVLLGTEMAITGTDCNCAGGRFDAGWVTCEETDSPGHGYAFLISVDGTTPPKRLDAWGRFKREAVAQGTDGHIYMSEDHPEGRIYRFRAAKPGEVFGAGVLEVLVLPGYGSSHEPGRSVLPDGFAGEVRWVKVPDPQADSKPCRAQVSESTRFYRTEGVLAVGDSVWFAATQGGAIGHGQLFRLEVGDGSKPARLHLALEVRDPRVLSLPDNLALTPWGDVLLCEDNYASDAVVTHQHLRLLTRDGRIFDLARNPQNRPDKPGGAPGAEFTGACFSPDGSVLFVNLQGDRDETVAIIGPWPTRMIDSQN
jgi:hypothetical protein